MWVFLTVPARETNIAGPQPLQNQSKEIEAVILLSPRLLGSRALSEVEGEGAGFPIARRFCA